MASQFDVRTNKRGYPKEWITSFIYTQYLLVSRKCQNLTLCNSHSLISLFHIVSLGLAIYNGIDVHASANRSENKIIATLNGMTIHFILFNQVVHGGNGS